MSRILIWACTNAKRRIKWELKVPLLNWRADPCPQSLSPHPSLPRPWRTILSGRLSLCLQWQSINCASARCQLGMSLQILDFHPLTGQNLRYLENSPTDRFTPLAMFCAGFLQQASTRWLSQDVTDTAGATSVGLWDLLQPAKVSWRNLKIYFSISLESLEYTNKYSKNSSL